MNLIHQFYWLQNVNIVDFNNFQVSILLEHEL